MKKIFTYIITVFMCLSIAGCSSAGGISTFTMAVEKMPANFDPQIASSKEDLSVITNIFEGLFEIQNGVVVNNLAESCNISPDGKTYTIKIKENHQFHCRGDKKEQFDGTVVKAKDFVFAINRILDSRTHSAYYRDFSNVESIYDTSDYTLEIILKNPDFNFSEKLAMTAAFPCNEEFFKTCGGAYGLTIDNILSNGPFRLNYLDSEGGNGTIVSVNEEKSRLQRIRIKQVEAASQADAFKNEEISGYISQRSQKLTYENSRQISFDSGNISLMFNLAKPVYANEKIRQAFAWYAFGFKNSGANMAAVAPAASVFPNTLTLAGEHISELTDYVQPTYLAEKPKALFQQGLAEIGVPKINGAVVLMPSDSIYALIYENINQLWQKNLGRFFTIEYLPTSQIKLRVENGDFDMAFLPLTPVNNTPYGILQYFTAFDGEVDNIVSAAKAMSDQKSALPGIVSAHNIVLEKALVAPMGVEQTVFYYRNYFENIFIDPFSNVINLKRTIVK